jgi:hypothetical protein
MKQKAERNNKASFMIDIEQKSWIEARYLEATENHSSESSNVM